MTARILVVDDTEPNRRLAQANLLAAGYDVTLAESGAEALARFRERTPDLVLLDILMPGMDGFETCRRLRALPAGGGTPIVFLTALGDLGTHEQAMASGADDFLTKPIRRTELLIRVRSLVHMARLQRQRDHLMDFIVHDLKGPLANILANTQYLKQKLDAQGDDALAFDDMVSGVDTMNRMVMDLLDVNRSDEGGLVATRRVVDVEALLSAIRDAAQRRADECGLGLVVASNLGGQALEADEDLLRRVIENLLYN